MLDFFCYTTSSTTDKAQLEAATSGKAQPESTQLESTQPEVKRSKKAQLETTQLESTQSKETIFLTCNFYQKKNMYIYFIRWTPVVS